MRVLGRLRAPPHQLPDQPSAHRARVLHHIVRDLQRPRERRFGRVDRLREQALEQLVVRGVRRARGDEVQGLGVADKARQEERRRAFGDEAAAGEDEADLGGAPGHADGHGQAHGDADADGGTLEGADRGLGALVDREGDTTAAGGG